MHCLNWKMVLNNSIKTLFAFLLMFGSLCFASGDRDLVDVLRAGAPSIVSRNTKIDNALEGFKQIAKGACKLEDCEHSSFSDIDARCGRGHMRTHMHEFIESVFRQGLINQTGYDLFISKFEDIEKTGSGSKKSRWYRGYKNFADDMKTALRQHSRPLVGLGEVSNISWCQNGPETNTNAVIFSLPNNQYEDNNPSCGLKRGEKCLKHTDCCSGECQGLDQDPVNANEPRSGSCNMVKTCYQLIELTHECSDVKPYCARGVCQLEDYDANGMNQCSGAFAQCSSNVDCCSDSCIAGKCASIKKCIRCTKMGDVPTSDKPCCAGSEYSDVKNKCVPLTPPFVLPTNLGVEVDKSLIQKALDFIIPSAHAAGDFGVQEGGSINATQGLQDFQIQELEKETEECAKKESVERNECAKGLSIKRNDMIAANENNPESEEASLTRNDWASAYDIPGITANKRSDFDTCQINSFLDQWHDSGVTERNAEIVLRGFEVALSGAYTKDYQNFTVGNQTQSVNDHLHSFMNEIRDSRIEMTNALADLDKVMFCKCILSKGLTTLQGDVGASDNGPAILNLAPDNFPEGTSAEKIQAGNAARNEMWNGSTCAEEKSQYTEKMAKRKEGEASEADSIASGIPALTFLSEWTEARSVHQAARMQEHLELEGKLEDLLNQYRAVDWDANETVTLAEFKKNWGLDTNPEATHYADKEAGYAHMFTVYKWQNWVVVMMIVGSVLLAPIMPEVATGLMIGAIVLAIENSGPNAPVDEHVKIREWTTFAKRKWKYGMWVKYPYYDNDRTFTGDKRCRVFGFRFNCLKNFYSFEMDPTLDLNSERGAEYQRWYDKYKDNNLIDLWLPAFYPSADKAYFVEDMAYVKALNESLERTLLVYSAPTTNSKLFYQFIPAGQASALAGIDLNWRAQMGTFRHDRLLKLLEGSRQFRIRMPGTNPGGERHRSWLDDIRFSNYSSYWVPDLTRMPMPHAGPGGYVDMLNQNLTAKKPDFVFNADKIEKYKEAVKKYADAGNLNEAGYQGPGGGNLIGFAGYFQTEADLDSFAHYVYHMHFMWPKLSAEDRIGYPMLGMEAYLDAILLNLKKLGSLNAVRGYEYLQLSEAYDQMLDERNGWFTDGVEADQGRNQDNVTLRKIRKANFAAVILGALSPITQGGSLTPELEASANNALTEAGGVAALSNETKSFLKTLAADKVKKEKYDKGFGSTQRGKAFGKRTSNFMKAFNSPLTTAKNAITSTGSGTAPIKKEANTNSRANIFNPANFSNSYSPSYGGPSSSYGASKAAPSTGKHGLRDSQVEKMLSNAKNDESLRIINPMDTIFHIVSKAYKRNLDRVLTLKESVAVDDSQKIKKEPLINDKKKSELKNLLDN